MLTRELLCHHLCLVGDLQSCFSDIPMALVSVQRCLGCWELLWGWMEKKRVGFPGRAWGGGEWNERRKRNGEAERLGGSSRCRAAGPWPSPEPVSSCPGSERWWEPFGLSLMSLEKRPGIWERGKLAFLLGLLHVPGLGGDAENWRWVSPEQGALREGMPRSVSSGEEVKQGRGKQIWRCFILVLCDPTSPWRSSRLQTSLL